MGTASPEERHGPHVTGFEPRSPLQLGNGQFALAVDVTGLQTFPGAYPGPGGGTLLGTMSGWGWHSMPYGAGYRLEDCLRTYDTPRGPVPYLDLGHQLWGVGGDGTPEEAYFRANPHRIDLGRVGLWLPGVVPGDLTDIDQRLDLTTGRLGSQFAVGRVRYEVTTLVDMGSDTVLLSVCAAGGTAGLTLDFPYASEHPGNAQDWDHPEAHTTALTGPHPAKGWAEWRIGRRLDDTTYDVVIRTTGTVAQTNTHRVVVTAPAESPEALETTIEFRPGSGAAWARAGAVAEPAGMAARTAGAWRAYWASAQVDLARSDHAQAAELERRIVLSRYLTRINSTGVVPVAETGLYVNSWRGKFHLEMQWWHLAHFALWGQAGLVEPVLDWYAATIGSARALAAQQGYPGARWLKSSGPEARPTPSSIASFLVWQQPHPVYLAELVRRAQGVTAYDRWWPVVRETAVFMAAYPVTGVAGLVFPPPLIPAQECYAPDKAHISDPAYELVYWVWGLRTAAAWADAVGERDLARAWRGVADRMKRPVPVGGVYPSIGTPPVTTRVDHPAVLAALGVTPGTGLIDEVAMAATLDDVRRDWDWTSTWGWDYPMMALTAARVGRPELAVAALLDPAAKNTYLENGHNWQTADLPAYLPGNGGLLTAVAGLVAGWDDHPAPGFGPGWVVEAEGIAPLP